MPSQESIWESLAFSDGRFKERYILAGLPEHTKLQIITPTKAIANYVKVPYYSLETLAQTTIRQRGWRIASGLQSRRWLQQSVRRIVNTKDVEGTASFFLPTIKSLLRAGIDLTALQQYPTPRIQQLANLALAYQQQLHQNKCIDAAELFWYGSQFLAAATKSRSYLFYGYFAPRRDELTFIDAVAGKDSILVLPINQLSSITETNNIFAELEQALAWLKQHNWQLITETELNKQQRFTSSPGNLGRQLQHCFLQLESLPSGATLHVYPNLEAEVRGVLAQVKSLLSQDVAAKDIVLVTRDEQLYGTTLIDVAWEYQLTVRALYEIPLEQTRIGAWLNLLLEVIETDFPFESTAKLLAHPLAQYISPEIWTQARKTHPQNYSAWQNLGIDLSLLRLPEGNYRRDFWLQRLQDILSNWQILEKGKRWAKEIVAYYRLQEALTELAQPAAIKISRQSFIQDVRDTLALLTVPAQPGRGGVELHNPTSLCGTQYNYVFVLGTADGILPTAIADDLVLDFIARKQLAQRGLAIETAVDLAAKETFNFYYLLGIPTQEIRFSYPQLMEGKSMLPSPYLQRLALSSQSIPSLPLVSLESARRVYLVQEAEEMERWGAEGAREQGSRGANNSYSRLTSDGVMPYIIHAWQVEASRESTAAMDEYDGVIGLAIAPESKIFSASQLTQLGQCPFKWFTARLLKLRELPEAELSLSSTCRGNLYHRCLELSLDNITTAADLATFNREQLEQAFRQAEQELNLTELSGWDAQRQEHLDLLAHNLMTAEFLPEAREVVATETDFNTEWYGLQIKGTVDRIDRTEQGLTVIDYKTSSTAPARVKDKTGKANLDIQLSLYVDAIAQIYPEESIDTATYYSLTKQKVMRRGKSTPEQLAAFAEQVKSHLQQGHFPVAPDVDRKACQYCAFDLVCRKGDRLSRKC